MATKSEKIDAMISEMLSRSRKQIEISRSIQREHAKLVKKVARCETSMEAMKAKLKTIKSK